jgi:hypothetical protein
MHRMSSYVARQHQGLIIRVYESVLRIYEAQDETTCPIFEAGK